MTLLTSSGALVILKKSYGIKIRADLKCVLKTDRKFICVKYLAHMKLM